MMTGHNGGWVGGSGGLGNNGPGSPIMGDWFTNEPLTIVDVGRGEFSFHSPHFNNFLRLTPNHACRLVQ